MQKTLLWLITMVLIWPNLSFSLQGLLMLLQNLPTIHWGNEEVGLLLAEAYRLKYTFADAPSHYKRWVGSARRDEDVAERRRYLGSASRRRREGEVRGQRSEGVFASVSGCRVPGGSLREKRSSKKTLSGCSCKERRRLSRGTPANVTVDLNSCRCRSVNVKPPSTIRAPRTDSKGLLRFERPRKNI